MGLPCLGVLLLGCALPEYHLGLGERDPAALSCDPRDPGAEGDAVLTCASGETCLPSDTGASCLSTVADGTTNDLCTEPETPLCAPGFGCDARTRRCARFCTLDTTDCSLCSNTCETARDGVCHDGGRGADGASCPLGTDCADCGPRGGDCIEPAGSGMADGLRLGLCCYPQGEVGECDLVSQCGCGAEERCSYDEGRAATTCTEAGGIPAFAGGCGVDDDCTQGTGCVRVAPGDRWGACLPYCTTAADCPTIDDRCVSRSDLPYLRHCHDGCDPLRSARNEEPFAACGPGASCTIVGDSSFCRGDSNPLGVQGQPCNSDADCAVDHACGSGRCRRYCRDYADCFPLLDTACADPIELGDTGRVYGQCEGEQPLLTLATSHPPLDVAGLVPVLSTIEVEGSGIVGRVVVDVFLDHEPGMLPEFALVSPVGTRIELVPAEVTILDGLDEFWLADDAVASVTDAPAEAAALPRVVFRPATPLALLAGEQIRGSWTVEAELGQAGGAATFVGWRLHLALDYFPYPAPGLSLSEVMARPTGGRPQWVEIANADQVDHDLAGCRLEHRGADDQVQTRYFADSGLVVPAEEFLVLDSASASRALGLVLDPETFELSLICGMSRLSRVSVAPAPDDRRSVSVLDDRSIGALPNPAYSRNGFVPEYAWEQTPYTLDLQDRFADWGIGTPGAANLPRDWIVVSAFDGVSAATVGAELGVYVIDAVGSLSIDTLGTIGATSRTGVLEYDHWPATDAAAIQYEVGPVEGSTLTITALRFTVERSVGGPTELAVRSSGTELARWDALIVGPTRHETLFDPPLVTDAPTAIEWHAWRAESPSGTLSLDDIEVVASW
ncbi:MAG: lamin tail domain-containing protein [Polyangiaceae bacterium]|nr:lamin tail domain-containing protein [Polyangiaceae bacterium]